MRYIGLLVLLAAGGICGAIEKTPPQIIEAAYTAGRWYREIEERHQTARRVHDPATVRFLWNENALFVGIEMRDADLVDESTADQTHIFQQADSVELFGAIVEDYKVVYTDGTEIEFNDSGNWTKIKAKTSSIPADLVPEKIRQYVKANFKNSPIVVLERKSSGYKVELASKQELKFDPNFIFVGLD